MYSSYPAVFTCTVFSPRFLFLFTPVSFPLSLIFLDLFPLSQFSLLFPPAPNFPAEYSGNDLWIALNLSPDVTRRTLQFKAETKLFLYVSFDVNLGKHLLQIIFHYILFRS